MLVYLEYTKLQCFETQTGPYGPTGKTVNPSPSRFFYAQESVYAKNVGNRLNRGSTARFWELWSNRFSRFPLNLNLKKKKKKKKPKTKEKETQLPLQRNKETQLPLRREKKKVHHVCHCHLQRNTTCLYVSSSSLFRAHHTAPSLRNSCLGRSKL